MAVAGYYPQLAVPRATAEPALTPPLRPVSQLPLVKTSRVLTGTCRTNLLE